MLCRRPIRRALSISVERRYPLPYERLLKRKRYLKQARCVCCEFILFGQDHCRFVGAIRVRTRYIISKSLHQGLPDAI